MVVELYDVIILGGGPAGLTAGIYTARHGLKTLLVESKQLGGKSWGSHRIENYPGFPEGVGGSELMDKFISQTKKFGVKFRSETVIGINNFGDKKVVLTRAGFYETKAVVIATGIQRKKLQIPGEMEFKGRGVSYCALCDGPLYTNKTVAVIGCGREAVEDSLKLAETAEKVYVIPGVDGFNSNIKEISKLAENEKIVVIEDADVETIEGDVLVTHINLKTSPQKTVKVDGVFIILEIIPTTDIINDVGILTNRSGCIQVDKEQKTNIDGIFAAGDCVCGGMQVVTAVGEGGRAGLSVYRYIKFLNK